MAMVPLSHAVILHGRVGTTVEWPWRLCGSVTCGQHTWAGRYHTFFSTRVLPSTHWLVCALIQIVFMFVFKCVVLISSVVNLIICGEAHHLW